MPKGQQGGNPLGFVTAEMGLGVSSCHSHERRDYFAGPFGRGSSHLNALSEIGTPKR